ncbi:LOW QUALITY PROTEIN: taste receptor type 2 member 40 [Epinephelus fuscoguttatus]|uniref:LOW QUALITY PROTEIN: taste receptor type 2 member 40 n=1 Tax=Epinephelus fuscoguttatus TaxID=293821 RepID=UPI0020D085EC|nr:LOW QUALITY PROTEIN: taste receptor type 2 member 40 [Epinephelus fuscoguttatus]
MFGPADLRLGSTPLLLVLGVLANVFNFGVMLVQQCRSGGVKTVAIIVCFISLSNILLQISTFVLVASVWVGVLRWLDLTFFYCVVLFVWLSSSSVSFWSVARLSVFYCVRILSFTSVLFKTFKENISTILNVTLVVTLLTSCVMFTPFLSLHYHSKTLVPNVTEEAACVIRKPLFPAWVDVNVYVITFICYLTLMPSMIMLPTSLRLVVYLRKHTLSVLKKQSSSHTAESYLLVCRVTVALVWVYLTTLLTISFYYFHAIFASGLSADMLFFSLSFYCVASAILLNRSNKNLREKLRVLIGRGKNLNTPARSAEDI